MGEFVGVLAAATNTVLGGLAVGVTRFVISATDPLTLGAFRFGIGCLLLLPFALLQLDRWPVRRDLLGVAMLGLLYFGLYPICSMPPWRSQRPCAALWRCRRPQF